MGRQALNKSIKIDEAKTAAQNVGKRGPTAPFHSDSVRIDQKPTIIMPDSGKPEHPGEVIIVDKPINKDYLDELSFQEEPVMIILNPTAEKNAPTSFPVWVNGKGAEVFQNGRWDEIGYLPIGRRLIIKRKYLEVIIRAKLDLVTTAHDDATVERPVNRVNRATSSVHSFSILEDNNPKGRAWAEEMIRRNM